MLKQATFRMAPISRQSEHVRVDQILELAKPFLPCRAVDLGTGSGLIGMKLREHGADITLVDCTPRRVMPEARRFFVRADVPDINLRPFDLIVCAGLMYHMPLSGQVELANAVDGKPVILDTHFSRRPDVMRGDYMGQFRNPTRSTQCNHPFVHTIDSLRSLFCRHELTEPCPQISADRKVMLLVPR